MHIFSLKLSQVAEYIGFEMPNNKEKKKRRKRMLKGCRKQMIVLRGTGSEIFDEAYFVLKKSDERKHYADGDRERKSMLLEANRIIEENRMGEGTHGKSYYLARYLLFFLSGILLGGGSVLLAVIIS